VLIGSCKSSYYTTTTDHPHLYYYPFWSSLYMNQVLENLYSDQWPYKTNIYLVNAIWLPAQIEPKQDTIKFIRFKLPVDDIKLPIEDNQYLVEGILSDLVPSYNSIKIISNRFSNFASSNMHGIVKQNRIKTIHSCNVNNMETCIKDNTPMIPSIKILSNLSNIEIVSHKTGL
jgi:hypothetical protein